MTLTDSTSQATSSTAFLACNASALTSNSLCATSSSSTSNTSVNMATTCRKSATGNGPIRFMKILVLNSGSSSQKSALYEIAGALPEHPPASIWQGKIEWDGNHAEMQVQTSGGADVKHRLKVESRRNAIEELLASLSSGDARVVSKLTEIDVVGQRIVHGGKEFEEAPAITPQVKSAIARMSAFAPLHNRAELDGIELIQKLMGKVLQVAVFDTGFHSRLPDAAAVYPGPYEWIAQGIRRYGFHGINHQYCAERNAHLLRKDSSALK